jgi:colanic acid biosynthesis protein WcaH
MTIKDASEYLLSEIKNPHDGLPQEVFDLVASIVPMVNVDLLVQNDKGEVLLSWRDDGKNLGWHIPGGIIRFKESFEERIQKTALAELGTKVDFDSEPLKISEIFMPYQHRGHFISFLYCCYLPNGFIIDNGEKKETENGFLKWHSRMPNNIVNGQNCYEKFLFQCFNNI